MAGTRRSGGSDDLHAKAAEVVELLGRKFPDGAPTDEAVRAQGFNWSVAQWRKRWPSRMALPAQLDDAAPSRPYVTRQDVFDRARAVTTETDAVELFLLMAAWGTGTQALPIARVAPVLQEEGAPKRLLSANREIRDGDPVEAYRTLYSRSGRHRMAGFGPSFFTKWLYFSAYESWGESSGPAPLILDARVAASLGWARPTWSATRYGDYLTLATAVRDEWAPGQPTHVVEYALFQANGSSPDQPG